LEELREILRWEGPRNWFRPVKSAEEISFPIINVSIKDSLIRVSGYLIIFIGVPLMLLWTLYANADVVAELAKAYGITEKAVERMAMAYTSMILIYWLMITPWERFWLTTKEAPRWLRVCKAIPFIQGRPTEENFEKCIYLGIIGGLLCIPFAMMLKHPAVAVSPILLLNLLWIAPAAETAGVVGTIAQTFRAWLGVIPGCIIAGLSFAMFHLFLLAQSWINIIPLTIIGFIFALLGFWKGSLIPPLVAHVIVNLLYLI